MAGWLRLSLLRLRDERPSALGFAALVLVTALVGAATPLLLDRTADATLRAELIALPPATVSVQMLRLGARSTATGASIEEVAAAADAAYAELPAELLAVVSERAFVVEGPRWTVRDPATGPTSIRLRIQPGAEARLHVVAGALPTGGPWPGGGTDALAAIPVALAAASARILGVGVGDIVGLRIDTTDTVSGRPASGEAAVVVAAIYEVDDPADRWWLGDPALAGPIIRSLGGDSIVQDVTALVPSEAYAALLGQGPEGHGPIARYTFRAYVDVALLDERRLAPLVPGLRSLETRYPAAQVPFGEGYAFRSGLRAALEGHRARWASASAVLSVSATGPAAVAFGALALVAVLAARRRRSALALSRGRGASIGQVVLAVATEGMILAGPATAIALAAALALLPGGRSLPSVVVAGAVAIAAVSILLGSTVPATGGPAFGGSREARVPRAASPRRLVFEGLLVVAAVAGALLLRERGIRGGGTAGSLATADPLIAAVPALVGLAAGVLAVRILPVPIGFAARATRRGRGLVAMLALRRASGDRSTPIVLVLLSAAAILAFSATAVTYLDRSAVAAGWRDIGADVRIVAKQGPLRAGFDPAAIPGVEAAAGMFLGPASIVPSGAAAELAAIDSAAYEAVVAGTPADAALPLDFFGPAAEPVPVIVSRRLVARADGPKEGETFEISVQGYTFRARIVDVRDDFPGLAGAPFFVVVSRDMVRELFPTAPLDPTSAFVRAPSDALPSIRAAVDAAMSTSALVDSRVERTAGLREAPIAVAIRAGIIVAAIVAGLYAALAVAAGLALSGASRSVEVAHLRTLGLSDAQASRLLVAEHAPTILLASIAGLALGVGLFAVLLPGLGLDALAGPGLDVPIGLDPALVASLAAGLLFVVLAGLGLGILLERRTAPVAALRRGFE